MILKPTARTIHLLWKQGLPLRGHREDMIDSETGTNRNQGISSLSCTRLHSTVQGLRIPEEPFNEKCDIHKSKKPK